MKLIKILTHPYIIIISFFIILINGEGFGDFFFLYLLMALPYGAIHSLLALLSIVLLLVNYYKSKGKKIDSTMPDRNFWYYFTNTFTFCFL
ncbi:MAG: hypothetical protein WKG06_02920 [Segetibacter sp.]